MKMMNDVANYRDLRLMKREKDEQWFRTVSKIIKILSIIALWITLYQWGVRETVTTAGVVRLGTSAMQTILLTLCVFGIHKWVVPAIKQDLESFKNED